MKSICCLLVFRNCLTCFSSWLAPLLVGILLVSSQAAVLAQTCTQTISSNAAGSYSYTTPGELICVTASNLSRDITIDAANCIIVFSGNTYTGNLTVTTKGTNCTITNSSGSNISGNSNTINAATTINNNSGATWSGNFYNGSGRITAPLTVVNAGTWGSGNQLEVLDNLTFTNTGTVNNLTFYGKPGLTSQRFVLTNNGTWSNGQVGASFAGTMSITNATGRTWGASLAIGTLAGFAIDNQGVWNAALGGFTVNSPVSITNAGTWNNVGFGQLTAPATTITNTSSGVWNNTQVSVGGALTINHANPTANTWKGVPVNESALTVNNSGNWSLDVGFPATGPNAFNTLAGGTTVLGNSTTIGGNTAFQNSGLFTINKSNFVLPAGSSISNLAGTFSLPAGIDNRGSVTNQATLNVTSFSNSGTFTNDRPGQVNVSSSFTNSGTVSNSGTVATTGSFTNSGTISGPAAPLRGSFTVTGTSVNSGFFGGNTTANRLNFCDSSSGTGGGFDTAGGSIGTSTVYCSAFPLPVELTRFAATAAKGRVLLAWATASEKNSAYFTIERSAEGREFAPLLTIKAQGNSTAAIEYQATDEQPLAGSGYYRLRQVDADGSFAFSPVVTVTTKPGPAAFTISPNPATDQVQVDLTTWPAQATTVEVVNMSGQVLQRYTVPGASVQVLEVRAVPAGVYLLRVRNAGQQTVRRLLKQ